MRNGKDMTCFVSMGLHGCVPVLFCVLAFMSMRVPCASMSVFPGGYISLRYVLACFLFGAYLEFWRFHVCVPHAAVFYAGKAIDVCLSDRLCRPCIESSSLSLK